jgi:hypothetical protein
MIDKSQDIHWMIDKSQDIRCRTITLNTDVTLLSENTLKCGEYCDHLNKSRNLCGLYIEILQVAKRVFHRCPQCISDFGE